MSEHITRDFMRKVDNDVSAVLQRILTIAPTPHLPIALAAGATVAALIAVLLDTDPKSTPDPDCILLAGLLIARTSISANDPVGAAYADFKLLKEGGRTSALTSPNSSAQSEGGK